MKNADRPAMPMSVALSSTGDCYSSDHIEGGCGLTKREHFAAMAPECPDWFIVHIEEFSSPLSEQETLDAAEYHKENYEYERYEEGQEAAGKERKAQSKYNRMRERVKFFQWRAHYADLMLMELEHGSTNKPSTTNN